MKKVYCYGPGFHTYIKNLAKNPPSGYEFILQEDVSKKRMIERIKKIPLAAWIYRNFIKRNFNTFNLVNSMYAAESPKDADLVLSTSSIISEKKPWILEILDSPFAIAGNDYSLFLRNLKEIERGLASPYCKRIITHTQICKDYLKKYFSKSIADKTIILMPAKKSRKFKRNYSNDRINILFMGSINNPDEFFMKGGVEALEAFKALKKRNKNVNLIMRCRIPEEIKKRYDFSDVEVIEKEVSLEELDKMYLRSDIFLSPGYTYFVMVFLESMDYGLPIVALDTYGVKEFVKNGINGYVIQPSKGVPINVPEYPSNIRSRKFWDTLKTPDLEVVNKISDGLSKMIDNPKLIRKMGTASKKMLELRFSIEKRNKALKKVFDSALS